MSKPFKFTNPDDLEAKVNAYFEHCKLSEKEYSLKNGDIKIRKEFPTMTGLAVWLHCNRETLYSYINGDEKTGISEEAQTAITNTLSHARNRIALELSQASMAGDADSRIASLLLNAMGETTPEVNATINVVIQGDSDAYSV